MILRQESNFSTQESALKSRFYSAVGKRLLDVIVSAASLLAMAPVFLVVSIAVRLSSPGPAFFRQERVGRFGKPFRIFKFRSMTGTPQGRGALLTGADDPRITPLGRWLRSTKIDELPQLINVLLGDMSLVGPRPEVPVYVAKYDDRQRTILAARPGISGISANVREEELLAGVADKESFYVSTILPAKLEFDIAYCQNISLVRDLKLLCGTVSTVIGRFLELHSPARGPQREV
jgi:lipopolysaccharide/colanic/teichoic acid biosynthesis glycosyltransferase